MKKPFLAQPFEDKKDGIVKTQAANFRIDRSQH